MILLLIADARSIHTQRWAEYFAQKGYEVHLITYDPMNCVRSYAMWLQTPNFGNVRL